MSTLVEKAERTVREVAIEHPAAIRIFEKYGIDYCCHGSQPLDTACARAGVNPATLMAEVESAVRAGKEARERNWEEASLRELTSYIIENHHAFIRREMPRLEMLIDKVETRHGEKHPEIARIRELFLSVRADIVPHMLKEEAILFPYIVAMERAALERAPKPTAFFGSVQNPVRMMVTEHEQTAELMARVRHETDDFRPPLDACSALAELYTGLEEFERDVHKHVHLENNILLPRTLDLEKRF